MNFDKKQPERTDATLAITSSVSIMSNNVSTDEFETVKQLLASAARYAESSHQRLDQVSIQQQRAEQDMRELREAQKKTEATVERLSGRVDSFVFEAQRLFTQQAASIEQLKGMNERLDGVLAYLIRKEQRGD